MLSSRRVSVSTSASTLIAPAIAASTALLGQGTRVRVSLKRTVAVGQQRFQEVIPLVTVVTIRGKRTGIVLVSMGALLRSGKLRTPQPS